MQGEKVSFVSNANQLRSRVLSDQVMAPYVKILLRSEETLKNSDLNWKYPTSSQPLWSVSFAGSKEKGYLNPSSGGRERMSGWLVRGCSSDRKRWSREREEP